MQIERTYVSLTPNKDGATLVHHLKAWRNGEDIGIAGPTIDRDFSVFIKGGVGGMTANQLFARALTELDSKIQNEVIRYNRVTNLLANATPPINPLTNLGGAIDGNAN